jgi:hypothetical protein
MSELQQIEDRILESNEECGNYYQIQELQEEAENIRNQLKSTKTYGELLAEIQPQVITNDAENDANLAHIERLWSIENRTPEEEKLFDLLLLLSEQFEEKAYPMESSWYAGLWYRIQAFIFRW